MADPFASNQPSTPSGTPGGGGSRGRNVTIVVLAIVAALAIAALIWAVVAANGKTPPTTPTATKTSASPTPTQTSESPTPTATGTAAPLATCPVGDLHVTLGTASGAAGSTIVPIIFTNTGSGPCELHGYPGVSFVGGGNGTQLGAAADEDQSVAITAHTLKPGGAVHSLLKIVRAQNVAGCTEKTADGLRVYPPHSYDAVFVKASGLTACTNKDVHLLTVQPVTNH